MDVVLHPGDAGASHHRPGPGVVRVARVGVCASNRKTDPRHSYVFARFQLDLKGDARNFTISKTIPTYLSLLIFGFVYQLILVYDALRMKNTIQVIGLCLYNVGILVYVAIELDQVHDAVTELLSQHLIEKHFWTDVEAYMIAVPCVVGLGTLFMAFIAWKLYDEFAWTIYKQISADLRMKRRYLIYQIYIALLKFDFFFFVGFTVQFLVIVSNTTNGEFAGTIVAMPITIIILFAAAYFVRRENLIGSVIVVVSCSQSNLPIGVSLADHTSPAVLVLRRARLFHVQAGAHVRRRRGPHQGLPPRAPHPHLLRRHHHPADDHHHQHSLVVHLQLQQGPQAVHHAQQALERRRLREDRPRRHRAAAGLRREGQRRWAQQDGH